MKVKRILAGFVAMAMTASMMSALVFADETENTPEETSVVETAEPKEKETKMPAVKWDDFMTIAGKKLLAHDDCDTSKKED